MFSLGACALSVQAPNFPEASACGQSSAAMRRVELIFGTTRRAGEAITDTEWSSFLDQEITPRFPDGLTLFAAYGQWRTPKGDIAKLSSRVLLIWYPEAGDADARIEAIRELYKQRFDQYSVMRIDGRDCVSF